MSSDGSTSRPQAIAPVWSFLRAGVLGAVFVVPAVMLSLGGNAFGPPKLVALLWAATFVCASVALDPVATQRVREVLRRSWIARIGIALVGFSLVSVAWAPDASSAFFGGYPDYRGALTVLACGVVALGVMAERDASALVSAAGRAASVLLLWLLAVALGEQLGLPPATFKLEGAIRTISTTGNASNLGVLLVLMVPFSVRAALFDDRRVWRYAGAVASAGAVIMLAWTLSRGAWLGVAAGVAVSVTFALTARSAPRYLPRSTARTRARMLLGGLLVTGLTVAVMTMPQVAGRVAGLLDTGSATAQWRLSTWRSAVSMVTDRPLGGFGVNGFRLVYPEYKQPGQDDGRLGYVPTESPHNATLETATSLGLPGAFALLALAGITVLVVARTARAAPPGHRGDIATIACALAAGTVALQLHYVTLDTGPALAALLALAAMLEARGPTGAVPDGADPPVRHTQVPLLALTSALLAAGLLATALMVGDTVVSRATRAASAAGADATRTSIARALRFASWEPAIALKGGRAALQLLDTFEGPAAAEDGARWYARAENASPSDPYIAAEAGSFHLTAAIVVDPDAIGEAQRAFERAASLDQNSGQPLAGLARVALVLGDDESAIEYLERSVELSPLDPTAWRDLIGAYERSGREEEDRKIKGD